MPQIKYNERTFSVVACKESNEIEIIEKDKVLGGYYERGACCGNFSHISLENALSLFEVQEILKKFKEVELQIN